MDYFRRTSSLSIGESRQFRSETGDGHLKGNFGFVGCGGQRSVENILAAFASNR
jgi:hypothetical protein